MSKSVKSLLKLIQNYVSLTTKALLVLIFIFTCQQVSAQPLIIHKYENCGNAISSKNLLFKKELFAYVDINQDFSIDHLEMQTYFIETYLYLDKNHNGSLGLREFKRLFNNKNMGCEPYCTEQDKEKREGQILSLYKQIDFNLDGLLTSTEINNVIRYLFSNADRNLDGHLSSSEYELI